MIPTARNIPPTQPSARQDALYPERGPSLSLYLPLEEWPRLPSIARIEGAHSDRAASASKKDGLASLGIGQGDLIRSVNDQFIEALFEFEEQLREQSIAVDDDLPFLPDRRG